MRHPKHEIVITVSRTGETRVAVEGIKGSGCKDITAALEAALGEVVSSQPTREFYDDQETVLRTRS